MSSFVVENAVGVVLVETCEVVLTSGRTAWVRKLEEQKMRGC